MADPLGQAQTLPLHIIPHHPSDPITTQQIHLMTSRPQLCALHATNYWMIAALDVIDVKTGIALAACVWVCQIG